MHFYSLFFLNIVLCDWIEIPQFQNKKNDTEDSTESVQENTLKRPQEFESTVSTTPLSKSVLPDNSKDSEKSDEDFSKNQMPQFANLLNMMKDEILDDADITLDGKINHLENLRDNISYEIKTRISELWKEDETQQQSRSYKDYLDYNNNHMEFPSNEGALMTIGFLTFSVFLIKLVLKLIYTLKYKNQYHFPMGGTTPASVFLKRNQREINQNQFDQSTRILNYIKEHPLV